jgi:hypothetical protein
MFIPVLHQTEHKAAEMSTRSRYTQQPPLESAGSHLAKDGVKIPETHTKRPKPRAVAQGQVAHNPAPVSCFPQASDRQLYIATLRLSDWGQTACAVDRVIAQEVSRCLPQWRPTFEPTSGREGFLVNTLALSQIFSYYFGFRGQFSFPQRPHTHASFVAGAINQLGANSHSELNLTPTNKHKKKNVSFWTSE